jgi:S1-C subfamily serine protease
VGFDQDKDVAVLRIDAPKDKLRPIPVGISADLLVGQKVFAIGNPVCNFSSFQSFNFLH